MKYKPLFSLLLAAAVLLGFLQGVSALERSHREEGRQQLEQALRRTAVTCYAAEGQYPPSVSYMEQHYALQYDREAYTVHYTVFASNLMPDITVLENNHDET
nr:hypothetical protein [Oscillospiraceae bacterium]